MQFGEKLKHIRKEKRITQKQLADKLNVSASMIAQYETGKRQPKLMTVRRIAAALGVTVAELLDFDFSGYSTEEKLQFYEENEIKEPWEETTKRLSKTIEENSPLQSGTEMVLLNKYRQLNTAGKEKVIDYADDLTRHPDYQAATPTETIEARYGADLGPEEGEAPPDLEPEAKE